MHDLRRNWLFYLLCVLVVLHTFAANRLIPVALFGAIAILCLVGAPLVFIRAM